ncbi:MAG TPA: alpha/beta fold hydrolase [Solirubrobacteraceae bacterium]|nr:alpha/beta fold hydrolase [Solirubrobacteraceae bacterium]
MSGDVSAAALPAAPLWGELRYSAELACLLADRTLRSPRRSAHAQPVLLIPGFMAGDSSLVVMRGWLRRRGHPVSMSGIRANVDCAERIVARLQGQLRDLVQEHDAPAVLIGQSRGGALARALAVREPEHVSGLVMLGSPVRDALAVAPTVMRTVRWMARLGDLRVPGVFSSSCRDGDCCEAFREELAAPLEETIASVAIHSRSDAIVDWRACLDPHGEQVEVDSSHCGMSVHPAVYRVLERVLDETGARAWNG